MSADRPADSELLEQLQAALGATYTFERELGGGGMSRVFLATERALERKVVIKILPPDLAAGLSAQRFTREIRLAAALQQANVVPVLSAGEAVGLPFYTMPFIAGLSLRDRLTRDGRLDVVTAIGVLRDVARALDYAHAHDVVHRDIKPENVLLSGEAAVVTDFGIAKAISAARGAGDSGASHTTVTQVGTAIGTPAYMSPEQISGDPSIDHRADLYSFGCVAYELLAGRLPFASTTVHGLFADHISHQAPPVTQFCPECPPELARVIMQCLEKSPEHRAQSAHVILRTLDGATTSTTGIRRFVNRMSRRQRLVASVSGAAMLIAVGALLARASLRAAHDPREESSLAVLPFLNRGDSTKDLWAEGLTDHVTTAMSRVSSVRYLATRLAVDRYRGRRNVDPREAGRALQVRHVLQGTLWPQGKQVQVDVVLSNAGDASEEWRDSFLSDAGDILATLDSATKRIAAAVQRRVAPASATLAIDVPSLRGTSDTAAYELYLRGEALLRSRGNVRRAVELFTQAIARDRNFARAYAGLSAALGILSNFADVPNYEVHDSLVSVAQHALAIDSTLAEARTALALAEMQAFRWREADSLFRLGLAIDPNDPTLRLQYARSLVYTGHVADAIGELRKAKRLDPTSAVISGWLAAMLLFGEQRSEAYAEMDRTLELDSTSVPAAYFGATVAAERGQRQRARALAEVIWHPGGVTRPAPWPGAAAAIFGELGDQQTVKAILRDVESRPLSRAFGHSCLADIALARGDTATLLDELERAHEAREFWPSSPILIALPAGIRRSERFKTLIASAGLDVAAFAPATGGRPR